MQGKAPSGGQRKRPGASAAEWQDRVGRIVLIRNGKFVRPRPAAGKER